MSAGPEEYYVQEEFRIGNIPFYIANLGVNYAVSKHINFSLSGNSLGERHRSEAKIFEYDPQTCQPTGNVVQADFREDIPPACW